MPTSDQLSIVKNLIEGFRLSDAEQRLRGVTIPLSVIIAVVHSFLETNPFFPPDIRPEELGDGAVVERLRDHHFRVHERFEVGQLRYSKLSSRSYFFLRSAVVRYLNHYGPLLRVDRVYIKKWS
jgi:hypothetical protein